MSRGLETPSPVPSPIPIRPKRKPKTQANEACILSTSGLQGSGIAAEDQLCVTTGQIPGLH